MRYLAAWLRRQRLRADPLADGRRGDRRDRARAAVAVAAHADAPAANDRGRCTCDDGTPIDFALLERALLGLPSRLGGAGPARRRPRAGGDRVARGTDPARRSSPTSSPCPPTNACLTDARGRDTDMRDQQSPSQHYRAQERSYTLRIGHDHELTHRRTTQARLGQQRALDRRHATYSAEDVVRLRGTVPVEHSLARLGAEKLWELAADRGLRQRARRADRQPGDAAGQGRAEGDLPLRLAGRRRRQPRRRDVSRPVAVSGQLGAAGGQAHQQHAAARRPDPPCRRRRQHRLPAADRRRRRGRLRRRAQRLRADEGDDRGRRGRRALRGPARLA